MIKVEAFDIAGGTDRRDLGSFESVQLTEGQLRDENDNTLAWLKGDLGWAIADGTSGWDIVISEDI